MFILYSMSTIYKIYKINKKDIEKIFIFSSKDDTSLNTILNEEELKFIQNNDINYEIIKMQIYQDDSIETIKKKIIKNIDNITFEEIYLFGNIKKKLNTEECYKILTQNGKKQLNKEILIEFLSNISDFNIETLPDKDIYNFEDLLQLELSKYNFINESIGQKISYKDINLNYTINPFKVRTFENIYMKNIDYLINTTNKNVLLTLNELKNNIIYLCKSDDVLDYCKESNLNEKNMIKIYFPYLFDAEIYNKEDLFLKKPLLLKKNKDLIDKTFIKNIENVALFYNIFEERKNDIEYGKKGIKFINFNIKPSYNFNLPLDIIFKIIHSDIKIPLIKYNPSKRMDKIYKLYCDKIATNGKKIPYLSKGIIFKIIKNIGNQKSLAFYINTTFPIILHLYQDATINVEIDFPTSYSIKDCEDLLKENINPIIESISDFIEESGYKLNLFNNLYDNNIIIENLQYDFYLPIENNINLLKINSCISSIFNIEEANLKNIIKMRFKRVNNYNEMSAIESSIIDLIKNEVDQENIIQIIKNNFNLNEKEVIEKLKDILSSIQILEQGGTKKTIKIKNNPGFLTTITQEQFKNNITISIFNINNIYYIDVLSIYIDSLIRLTQNPESTKINIKEITKFCTKKELKKENEIEEIKPPSSEKVDIEIAEELIFDTPEKVSDDKDDLFNILIGSDVESDEDLDLEGDLDEEEIIIDEDEIELEGGKGSSNSSKISNESEKSDKKEKKSIKKKKIKVIDDEKDFEVKIEGKKLENDVTGMNLLNPNPFYKRMENRDPKLFESDIDGKFKAYSRLCPWNVKRQPVILTDKEKEDIDKNHPGSYDEAIKYGSDKDNQFWYICPRYWSLKYNTSLTEEEVKSGKYGNVIPDKSKKVPNGASIFEFTDSKEHMNSQGEYVKHYPGFLKEGSHPEDLCIPCCFKSWDSPAQKERRDQCINNKVKEKEDIEQDDYIKGSDKFPLEKNRWGYLPIAVQKYLQTDNKKCQISVTNTNLKSNHLCFLRRGIEFNKNQSFLSCISDIYSDINSKKSKNITIVEMKKILIDSLDLDIFMTLQNGTLITNFKSKNIKISDINIEEKYKKTKIYSETNMENDNQKKFLFNLISSYENFIKFINDDNIQIDYTYLWDLLCIPNEKLFPSGLNLIILELSDNDITNNINLICPTNHYASELFDINKNSIILIKNSNYFEPIYGVEDKVKSIIITKLFNVNNKNLPTNIRDILLNIDKTINKYCVNYPSLPNYYKFKENLKLSKIIKILKENNYDILEQIINYNNNVIGIIIQKEKYKGFIPCLPSSLILDINFKYMDDENIWNNYQDTKNFLNFVYEDTNKKILCNPVLKVFEDELIVGIITETNQFISINIPEIDTFNDNIPSLKENNYINVDIKTSLSKEKDKERIKYINNISLETQYYNTFRNTVRILLGLQKHITLRKEIEELINLDTMNYFEKLRMVNIKLRELTRHHINFIDEKINELDKITTCSNLNEDKCKKSLNCDYKDEKCILKIPKINLINNNDNESLYYSKLSDELIRYIRINEFIFESKSFLSFNDIKYNLNDDEIILLQSLLTQDYFENIELMNINPYIKNNSYFNINPQKTQYYSNEFLDIIDKNLNKNEKKEKKKLKIKPEFKIVQPVNEKDKIFCKKIERGILDKWKDILSENCNEIYYEIDNKLCTFKILINIINNYKESFPDSKYNINSINQLKEILLEAYKSVINEENINIIYEILELEGKNDLIDKIKLGVSSFDIMILSEDYYMTSFDLWLIAEKLNLPILLISPTKISFNNELIFKLSEIKNDFLYIIKVQKTKINEKSILIYKLITCDGSINLLFKDFSDDFTNMIEKSKRLELENYLKNYNKKGKKKLKILENINDEDDREKIKIKIKKK